MFVHIPPHHALSGVSHPRESFKCLFSEEKATAKRIGWGAGSAQVPEHSGRTIQKQCGCISNGCSRTVCENKKPLQ